MENFRKYGSQPFSIGLVHGGPGGLGEMAPVAQELSQNYGVVELLQTANSVEGLLEEMAYSLLQNSDMPVTLIGWSWGAMLSIIFTACYPDIVKKLILVGSGVLESGHNEEIMARRMANISDIDRTLIMTLIEQLQDPHTKDKSRVFAALGKAISKADSYDPLPDEAKVDARYDLYKAIWPKVEEMRYQGLFIEFAIRIKCPVVAIHGDYDPRPFQPIQALLKAAIEKISFHLLPHCGHTPWLERQAKDDFYKLLRSEIE